MPKTLAAPLGPDAVTCSGWLALSLMIDVVQLEAEFENLAWIHTLVNIYLRNTSSACSLISRSFVLYKWRMFCGHCLHWDCWTVVMFHEAFYPRMNLCGQQEAVRMQFAGPRPPPSIAPTFLFFLLLARSQAHAFRRVSATRRTVKRGSGASSGHSGDTVTGKAQNPAWPNHSAPRFLFFLLF